MNFRVPFLLCLFVLIAAVIADEYAVKMKLKECFDKELDKRNKEAPRDIKLSDENLEKMKAIVRAEIDKEPLKKHSPEEQKNSFVEMEQEAKKVLPGIPQDSIDMILRIVRAKSMHCSKEVFS
ncbi:hypothetical protein OAory_01112320 [Aspergillus oryzae]|uniref:Uncharacterized protein n=1 Tax=Aspergillus oryzae TaxID=5062 RepID=A0A1S9D733_ASPOZ|nr:hypothetical protein OAory_01112320 [Aspergillus oryzae]